MSIAEVVSEVEKSKMSAVRNALRSYYVHFDTKRSITFSGAASKAGANPADMVDYICAHGLGMPEDREEARIYLRRLNTLG
jgi:hypothetical protein